MKYQKNYFLYLAILLLLSSCRHENVAQVDGTINFIGSSKLYIEKQPIHYKYAERRTYPIKPDNRGKFIQPVPVDSQQVVFFNIDNADYPVVAIPGKTISLSILRETFPNSVTVTGYPEPWDKYFSKYLREEQRIRQQIDRQEASFKNGEPSEVLDLYKHRYKLAKRHLGETPLDLYYYRSIGEYLVKRLEDISHRRGRKDFIVHQERDNVIKVAKELNFFSYESLLAQRAGIRDFTNAYANTFGVEDSLEENYGQELMQYDVKRLGYKVLNKARVSVLKHIEDRDALAYAKMYLIAERIGEMSPETAEQSYRDYLKNYSDYPQYTEFLRSFYAEIKKVSLGNTAIPFSISNQYGKPVSMKAFKGKYVLLDFWTGRCIPCLDEMPHMRKLYEHYGRDQFEIVAISLEKDSLRWRRTLKDFRNPWPQLYAGNGFQQKTFQAYKGDDIPLYILINPDGNIERYNDIRPSFNLPKVLDSLITERW